MAMPGVITDMVLLIQRESAGRKEDVSEMKHQIRLLQKQVCQISKVLQDAEEKVMNSCAKLQTGLDDEAVNRDQSMEQLNASLSTTVLKEIEKCFSPVEEQQWKLLGSVEALISDLFKEHKAETEQIKDEQRLIKVSLDALHDSAEMTPQREMEISMTLNERINAVSQRHTSLHQEIMALTNQLRISERQELRMQKEVSSIHTHLSEQALSTRQWSDDIHARLMQQPISNDAWSTDLDALQRQIEDAASAEMSFKKGLAERMGLLQSNVALTEELQEQFQLHEQFKVNTEKFVTTLSSRMDIWFERTQKQFEGIQNQLNVTANGNQKEFEEVEMQFKESQPPSVVWLPENQRDELQYLSTRSDALSRAVPEVAGKVGDLSDTCKVVAARPEVMVGGAETFPAVVQRVAGGVGGSWEEVLAEGFRQVSSGPAAGTSSLQRISDLSDLSDLSEEKQRAESPKAGMLASMVSSDKSCREASWQSFSPVPPSCDAAMTPIGQLCNASSTSFQSPLSSGFSESLPASPSEHSPKPAFCGLGTRKASVTNHSPESYLLSMRTSSVAAINASARTTDPESNTGFILNTTPWSPLTSRACKAVDHEEEEEQEEDNFRQQDLGSGSTTRSGSSTRTVRSA